MKISDEKSMLAYGHSLGADFLKQLKKVKKTDQNPASTEAFDQNSTSAEVFAQNPTSDEVSSRNSAGAIIVELIGDIGAGKTTLTRGIAEGLGVKTPVTSPSFTISKRYSFPEGNLIHYDFYRLPDPGLMLEELEETINEKGNVVILEWADSVTGILPEDHLKIQLSYNDDGTRNLEIIDKASNLENFDDANSPEVPNDLVLKESA